MKAISGGIRYLNRVVSDAAKVSDYSVLAVGLIGTVGHPVYWLWWTFIDPQPNENLLMGIVAQARTAPLLTLAASIAHEMRNPLSQLKHVLDRVEEVLPAAIDHDSPPAE